MRYRIAPLRVIPFVLNVCWLMLTSHPAAAQNDMTLSDYLSAGWQAMEDNELQKAESSFWQALSIDPQNVSALEGLGRASLYLGRREETIQTYERLLKIDPQNLGAHLGLARCYSWNNEFEMAIDYYQKARQIAPQDKEIQVALAEIYAGKEQWRHARAEYQKILETDPRHTPALEGLKKVDALLALRHRLLTKFLIERDAGNFKGQTFSYGYRQFWPSEAGRTFYGAYYLINQKETGKTDKLDHVLEIGGRFQSQNLSWLTLADELTLHVPEGEDEVVPAGSVSALARWAGRNTLALRYERALFDLLDDIKVNRYGADSSIYFHPRISLTNAFTYGDFSDGNNSTDLYHYLAFELLKKNPDLSFTAGYRQRDYDEAAPAYYSPQELSSVVYSLYLGKALAGHYLYSIVKFLDNSDGIDNFYYLVGSDFQLQEDLSTKIEVSFFDTTAKYEAWNIAFSLDFKF